MTQVSGPRYRTELVDASAVREEWEQVVVEAEAPLFYQPDVLDAYRQNPLRETLREARLCVRNEPDARLVAVLPIWLLPASDPLCVLGDVLPGFQPGGRPLLLSHVWHWYDTHLPSRSPHPGVLDSVCQALEELAGAWDAQGYGFVNVPAGGPLAERLAETGRQTREIDGRWQLDLRPFGSVTDYLATLTARVRQDLARQVRLARRQGYEVRVLTHEHSDPDVLTQVAELCRVTSDKHGNPGWFDPSGLVAFTSALGTALRIVAIESPEGLVAGSISLLDGTRLHNWTAGTVPLSDLPFSPYSVLIQATVALALAEGCTLLEGGRRNDAWKQRLGMTRVPLLAWMSVAGHNYCDQA
jgi:hypothetical protein